MKKNVLDAEPVLIFVQWMFLDQENLEKFQKFVIRKNVGIVERVLWIVLLELLTFVIHCHI